MPAFGHRVVNGALAIKSKQRGGLTADLTFTDVPRSPVEANMLGRRSDDGRQ